MTNRECLILSLRSTADGGEDLLGDGYASADSNVAYWVSCPHPYQKKGVRCEGLEWPWSKLNVCGLCKQEWLDEEVSE